MEFLRMCVNCYKTGGQKCMHELKKVIQSFFMAYLLDFLF